jgi:hypothetical protein
MRRIFVWTIVVLGSGLLVSGCTPGSHPGTPTPSVSSVSEVPQTGLRGVRLPGRACPTSTYSDGHRRVTGPVVSFGLCQLGQAAVAVTITRAQPARFAALRRALSGSDVTPGLDCAAPAFAGPWVIARTAGRTWLLHEPIDACGGVQTAVYQLVNGLASGRL